VSPQLEILFNLSGSADAPVADVTFAGIDFRDQRDGFLEDWIVPSGGDWGLRRAAALHLAGTARATVDGCSFIRTDGNAIAISGWNRNATISSTEFKWLGMSAVVEMGYTDEEDGTAGEQPWGTVITGCAVSELGLLEKQSSALFLGKTPLTRFEGNLAFNGPRAMINLCVPPQQALRSAARPDETDLSDVRVAPRALFFFQQRRLRRRPQYEPQRHVEHLPRDW
jgi:hypothetical protein